VKLFLINLDRADDRRDHMMNELSRLVPDVLVERAMCIDIKTPGWSAPAFVTPGRWRSDRWSLGSSDIEIFRSHIDCWEKIAASGETGVVLEDDLLFSDDFASAILKLEAAQVRGIVRLDGVGRPLILEKAAKHLDGFTLCPVGSLAASAGAYMLDPRTAAELVDKARIERTVDDFLFDPTPSDRGARGHGLTILQLEPVITIQAQFGKFADPMREVPSFLEATKRVDARKRKSRVYLGPWPYRVRKELLRALYRRRLSQRIQSAISYGGRWTAPDLCPDLIWD
jgi:GR25 family glycosyltransferase involved in LPS biosynthesis